MFLSNGTSPILSRADCVTQVVCLSSPSPVTHFRVRSNGTRERTEVGCETDHPTHPWSRDSCLPLPQATPVSSTRTFSQDDNRPIPAETPRKGPLETKRSSFDCLPVDGVLLFLIHFRDVSTSTIDTGRVLPGGYNRPVSYVPR